MVTTFILVAGFLVLSFSGFEMNSGMAKITALTVCLALVVDLLMLPALLIAVDRQQAKAAIKNRIQVRIAGAVKP